MKYLFLSCRLRDKKGVTLVFSVILLSVFLSFGLGIVNILLGQIMISGQAGQSFDALYAADRGIERTLYRDLVQSFCDDTNCDGTFFIPNDGCYTVNLSTGPSAGCTISRCISVTGQDNCSVGIQRFVKRAFTLTY